MEAGRYTELLVVGGMVVFCNLQHVCKITTNYKNGCQAFRAAF